jgi:hypothetical protein
MSVHSSSCTHNKHAGSQELSTAQSIAHFQQRHIAAGANTASRRGTTYTVLLAHSAIGTTSTACGNGIPASSRCGAHSTSGAVTQMS